MKETIEVSFSNRFLKYRLQRVCGKEWAENVANARKMALE